MEETLLRRAIQGLQHDLKEIRYAIWALESVASGKPRRGRPPKFVAEFPSAPARSKPRGPGRPRRAP